MVVILDDVACLLRILIRGDFYDLVDINKEVNVALTIELLRSPYKRPVVVGVPIIY